MSENKKWHIVDPSKSILMLFLQKKIIDFFKNILNTKMYVPSLQFPNPYMNVVSGEDQVDRQSLPSPSQEAAQCGGELTNCVHAVLFFVIVIQES